MMGSMSSMMPKRCSKVKNRKLYKDGEEYNENDG
jgi:hypothetical protein